MKRMYSIFFGLIIFVASFTDGMTRQELRSLYKDDQHQWIASIRAPINTCGICLEPGKLKCLSCHKEHKFHTDCIEEWRNVNNTCPICRAEIKDSIVCTCIESIAKPAVCIPTGACIVALIKSGDRLANCMNVLDTINSFCEQNGNNCMCFCVYCMGSLAIGPLLHYATKRD